MNKSHDGTNQVYNAAFELLRCGFSVLPVHSARHPERPKTPVVSWKQYQTALMGEEEAKQFFVNGTALAVIGGAVSGNLECIDFDRPDLFKPFMDTLEGINPGLAGRLLQRGTPSGGFHLVYRCEEPVDGNLRLTVSHDGKNTWIETRGEGGYFLHPPSEGYEIIKGSLKNCPRITVQERTLLLNLARSFSEQPEPSDHKHRTDTGNGNRPGDFFNLNWEQQIPALLEQHGWTYTGRTGPGGGHWTRPGKNDKSTSATLKNGSFYVFSSNAHPLEPGRCYDAFGLYTHLEHGGDFEASSRALAKKECGNNDSFHGFHASDSADIENINWPDPLPIEPALPPVINITEEMIPSPFKGWVLDAADRMQVPTDFLITPLLVVCGSLIGTACKIQPKQKDDWTVVPNLWGGIVGPPSMLKSPALGEIVNKTVGRLEVAARERHEQATKDHEVNMTMISAQKKAIQADIETTAKQARKGSNKGKTLDELAEELKLLDSTDIPSEHRYKTNDSSIEKLVELLNQNPRGLLYFRDELIGLFKRMERAGHEQDRAFLLEAWNGDGSHVDDRIGRGTVRTDNLCVSLLGGIQPDKIASYLHGAISDGENDGFVQRLQMMVYPDSLKKWQYRDSRPDNEAKNRAYAVIESLAALELETDQQSLHFSPEGQEVFKHWLTVLQMEKLNNADEHPVMLEHLAKYRSLMPTLALIFSLIDAADRNEKPNQVNEHAAQMAAAWCQYLESHARRIYSLAIDLGGAGAAHLANKIKSGKLGSKFKRHEIVSKKWGMLTRKSQVQEAIDYLIEHGWLKEIVTADGNEKGGRPDATVYLVNPKIFPDSTKRDACKP